jgi:quercetin dioxygenase-like cupin family protein
MRVQPKNPTVKGPADWFTGDVYIDAVAQGHGETPTSVGLVHFTPGARTAWHSHSVGQTLYVTEGEGRVQARGEPVVTLRTGDSVFAPGDEWHWHGAAPDHFMVHLAISEGGASWGEKVTDAEYGAAGA